MLGTSTVEVGISLPCSVLHYNEYIYMCDCVCIYSMSVCIYVLEWNQSSACIQQVGTYKHRRFAVRQQCQHRLPDTSPYISHIAKLLITAAICQLYHLHYLFRPCMF